jgi:hypothetical protein
MARHYEAGAYNCDCCGWFFKGEAPVAGYSGGKTFDFCDSCYEHGCFELVLDGGPARRCPAKVSGIAYWASRATWRQELSFEFENRRMCGEYEIAR